MAIIDSAGILICRRGGEDGESREGRKGLKGGQDRVAREEPTVLLVHSRAPLLSEAWSIPKGEFEPDQESPRAAAVREVEEELGLRIDPDELQPLGISTYRNKRKRVHCYLWETFGSPEIRPDGYEIGAAEFMPLTTAATMVHDAQVGFVQAIERRGYTMKAIWNDTVLAESEGTIVVEGNHYFPPDSLAREHFQESATRTVSPWKGEASYFDIVINDAVNRDAAWYYPATKAAAEEVRGQVAFWRGVDVNP